MPGNDAPSGWRPDLVQMIADRTKEQIAAAGAALAVMRRPSCAGRRPSGAALGGCEALGRRREAPFQPRVRGHKSAFLAGNGSRRVLGVAQRRLPRGARFPRRAGRVPLRMAHSSDGARGPRGAPFVGPAGGVGGGRRRRRGTLDGPKDTPGEMGRQQILQRPVWLCLHGGRLHHLDAGQALAPRSAQARRGPRRAGRRAHFPAAPPHLLGRHPLPPARQGWEPRQHPRTRAPARAGVPRAHRLLVLRPAHHGQRAAVPGALARARGPREALAVRGVHQGRRGRVLRPRRRGELVRTHAEAPREHPERARGRPRAIEDSEDADSMTRMISRRINRGRAGDACDRCGGEGEEGGLLRCSGCKVTRHCGAACQRAAWGKHKATCREWS